MNDAILITQAEAAAVLGLTPGGLLYAVHTRRLLKGRRRGGRMFYALAEVDALRQQRAGVVKTGRPSGRDLLQRRLLETVQ